MSAPNPAHSVGALISSLEQFRASSPHEECDREFILEFARTRAHPFNRSHLDAHLTASALIVDFAGEQVLLGFHRKLNRWLQLGGHGEPGEVCSRVVAFREAREESGIADLQLHPAAQAPFDVDVHEIPARPDAPAHLHLDLRYLMTAPPGAQPRRCEEEHMQVRWWGWQEAEKLDLGMSLHRMLEKARAIILSGAE